MKLTCSQVRYATAWSKLGTRRLQLTDICSWLHPKIHHDIGSVDYKNRPLFDARVVKLGPSLCLLVFCGCLVFAIQSPSKESVLGIPNRIFEHW